MSFSMLPPEVNSALMFAGPGAGPLWAAAQAWEGIGAELNSAASTFSSVTSNLAVEAWRGPASVLMTDAAGPYAGWLSGAAAQAEESASQARAAAAAFEAAQATVVDPGLVTANRGRLVSLVISNLFGQNAPAIAAAEAEYERMWAHDVAVMFGYHSGAAAAVGQLGQWEQALENLFGQIQLTPTAPGGGFGGLVDTLVADIFGSSAGAPVPAKQNPTFGGTSSLLNNLEIAGLRVGKQVLLLSGLGTLLEQPNGPLLQALSSDVWPLSFIIGNSPPKFLPFLFGETIQHTTYDGMSVIQITPANPSGHYVVALHGGVFFLPVSIFHWFDYTLMANQTGATFEVPIYPLLQQGGTAGTVVPQVANYLSWELGQHGASNVSLTGDSAGGNLALAAVQYILAGDPHAAVPASMVLVSPWLDVSLSNPNLGLVNEPLNPIPVGQQLGKLWAGNLPEDNYLVSPLYGSLQGLPPTYVYSSSLDSLGPDAVLLMQHAAAQNAQMSFVLASGEFHDWILLSPDGFQYIKQIEQELSI